MILRARDPNPLGPKEMSLPLHLNTKTFSAKNELIISMERELKNATSRDSQILKKRNMALTSSSETVATPI